MSESPVIVIDDIVKNFRIGFRRKMVEAVRGLSFEVKPGEVFGFLGPNGAGKTTSIKICMNLIRPTSGAVRIFGRGPGDLEARRRIGYLPEHPYFYDYLRPDELLDFFGRIYGVPRAERRKRADYLLELVGLGHARDRSLRKYSKGMAQRFGIAQTLISDPDLVVLDEPLTGLDPIGRKEMKEIFINLHNQGKTLFFSSHILSDVEVLCDRIAMINKGKLLFEGYTSDLLKRGKRSVELSVTSLGESVAVSLQTRGVAVESVGDRHKLTVAEGDAGALLAHLVSSGAAVESMIPHTESLEEIFVRIAQPSGGDA